MFSQFFMEAVLARLNDCNTTEKCLDMICTGASHGRMTDFLDYFVKSVVRRMYCCSDMNMEVLRNILLRPPVSSPGRHFSIENMIKNWEENVGPLGRSLTRSTPGLVSYISELGGMRLKTIRKAFREQVGFNEYIVGIMDLLFFASGFDLDRVRSMGSLFWSFCKHMIQLHVPDSDRLNLLLYDRVLPQTILCLEDIEYRLDYMLSDINCELAFRGKIVCNEDNSIRSKTKILLQREISFIHDTEIEAVDFQHREPSMTTFLVGFLGLPGADSCIQVHLKDVRFEGGGIKCIHVRIVQMMNVSFRNCGIAFYMNNVCNAFIFSNPDRSVDHEEERGVFSHCELAMFFFKVKTLDVRHVEFRNCKEIVDGIVSHSFEVTECLFSSNNKMGKLIMSVGKRPLFFGNQVLYFVKLLLCFTYLTLCDRNISGLPLSIPSARRLTGRITVAMTWSFVISRTLA